MKKIVVSWIICVLGLVALFAFVGRDFVPHQRPHERGAPTLIEGDFSLEAPDGKTVTAKDFRGRYMLVFFGFTHCPDICPTTLLLMQNATAKLGDLAKKIQPVFITIDPERDTPKAVGEYVGHFGSNIVGLSGSSEQVKDAADNYKVYYSKVEMNDPSMGYMMNHSGFLYLMGPDGGYLTHFANGIGERELETGLRKYVH